MVQLTKAEALDIQARQVAHYLPLNPGIDVEVAALTTADALEDGVLYDMVTINRHIPRGTAIERLTASYKSEEARKAAADFLVTGYIKTKTCIRWRSGKTAILTEKQFDKLAAMCAWAVE